MADNDYAVGRLVDKVAHSPYKANTLVFIVEDDAQSGADHMDAHRSTAYIVGPYIKHGAVVSVRYSAAITSRMKSEGATSVALDVLIERSEIYTFEGSKGNTFCNFPANAIFQPSWASIGV